MQYFWVELHIDGISHFSEILSKGIQKCYDKIKNYNILH